MKPRISILGVPFDTLSMNECVAKALKMMEEPRQHLICTPNPEIVMEAQTDKELMGILRTADMVLPDGVGVVWASKYTNHPLSERVAGFDFLQNLLAAMENTEHTVYFFGGAPGVAAAAARKAKAKHPNLKIVGSHNGYFDAKEEQRIIKELRELSPTLLLAGLGAPKQEKWLYDNMRLTSVRLGIGIGGCFDVMAGNVKRAPKLFQKMGLEWFYRLLCQPKRIFRMMKLPKFVLAVKADRRKKR